MLKIADHGLFYVPGLQEQTGMPGVLRGYDVHAGQQMEGPQGDVLQLSLIHI